MVLTEYVRIGLETIADVYLKQKKINKLCDYLFITQIITKYFLNDCVTILNFEQDLFIIQNFALK